MLSKIHTLILATLLTIILTGCHTVGGFGEDVQHVGGAIERSAN